MKIKIGERLCFECASALDHHASNVCKTCRERRDKEIASSTLSARELAEKWKISRERVYEIFRYQARLARERDRQITWSEASEEILRKHADIWERLARM